MGTSFDLETLTLDDIRAVIDLAWKRWGGIARAVSDLQTTDYEIRRWLREQPRTFPTGHQWLQMIDAAADEVVERITSDLGTIGVGVRSVVLLMYPTDADLRALTEDKWGTKVQEMVMREAAATLRTRKIAVTVAPIDNAGYRRWCKGNEIEENESVGTRTAYALSKLKRRQ